MSTPFGMPRRLVGKRRIFGGPRRKRFQLAGPIRPPIYKVVLYNVEVGRPFSPGGFLNCTHLHGLIIT